MDAAMNTAVSALQAQQAALSTVSDNLANSQTNGFKAVTTEFNSLLTQSAVGLSFPAGGVSASARQNLLNQGVELQSSSDATTDMAIDGNGMFAVSNGLGTNNDFFTRNGAFDPDQNGNLQLSGTNYYLLGWPTDAKGNVISPNQDNIGSLQNVNINKFNNTATATTQYSLQANLPAEAQSSTLIESYTTNATPPTTQNLSISKSVLNTNVTVNGVSTTEYTLSVTTSDPNAGGILDSNGATSQPGQALTYKVYVDSNGNIQQMVDNAGNVTTAAAGTPLSLPTWAPASGDVGSSTAQGITGNTGPNAGTPLSWSQIGTPFSENTTIGVFDSLGTPETFPTTWQAAGNNTWILTVHNPTDPQTGAQTGQLYDSLNNPVDSYSYQVSFNSDGSLNSITGLPTFTENNSVDPPTATLNTGATAPVNAQGGPVLSATWNDKAQASLAGTTGAINVNFGTAGALGTGKTDGLSQFDTGETTPSISKKGDSQNGVQFGQLTGVSVDDATGNVIATYSNGQKVPIYKIPVVTFPNENGLTAENNGVYQASIKSGTPTLNPAGSNGAGTIQGQTLEQSNVDTSAEFSNMITAQQAYSAASQVIGTDKQMFTALIQVVQ